MEKKAQSIDEQRRIQEIERQVLMSNSFAEERENHYKELRDWLYQVTRDRWADKSREYPDEYSKYNSVEQALVSDLYRDKRKTMGGLINEDVTSVRFIQRWREHKDVIVELDMHPTKIPQMNDRVWINNVRCEDKYGERQERYEVKGIVSVVVRHFNFSGEPPTVTVFLKSDYDIDEFWSGNIYLEKTKE